MSKIMYKTSNFGNYIEEVEIEKRTNKTVWYYPVDTFAGNKSNKLRQDRISSSYNNYFNTREEAIDYHKERLINKIKSLDKQKKRIEKELIEIESL